MPTYTYQMLYLGKLADMDPDEGTWWDPQSEAEDIADVLRDRTFGDSGNPLFAQSTVVDLNDNLGNDGTISSNHNQTGSGAKDTITYTVDGQTYTAELDSTVRVYSVQVVQITGPGQTRTITVPVRLMQTVEGHTFMMPPPRSGAEFGESQITQYPIVSVKFPNTTLSNSLSEFSGVTADRAVLPFRDGYVDGTAGNDTIIAGYFDGAGDRIDSNDAILTGMTGNDDYVRAGAGNDRVEAGAGNDIVDAGSGNDTVYGGTGNDTLYGGSGNDSLYGDTGNDSIEGGANEDQLFGGIGNDTLKGDAGDDRLYGGAGNDSLYGGGDNDTLYGDDGSDRLYGGEGADRLEGGANNDTLYGDDGNDLLYGGSSSDTLYGGAGNDTLHGGDPSGTDTSADVLYGGDGFDRFHVGAGDAIEDFNTATGQNLGDKNQSNNDFVDLSGRYNQANLDIVNAKLEALGRPTYRNPLHWLREDQADGVLDDLATYIDPSYGTIRIRNNNTAVAGSQLTWDNTNVECFASDVLIATEAGDCAAGELRVGDLVATRDAGLQPIRWIGQRHVSAERLAAHPNLRPIRTPQGALGAGLPNSDMLVSPQHRILVRSQVCAKMFGTSEALIAAKHLCGLNGIAVAEDVAEVTYVHILFDQHHIVTANGAETESFFTGAQALSSIGPEALAELQLLFPELTDASYVPRPARALVPGRMGRQFALRHSRNGKPVVSEPVGALALHSTPELSLAARQ